MQELDKLTPTQRAILELRQLRAQIDEYERRQGEPIAIVGMGCRFPGGADSPEAFWRLLRDGVDAVREVPSDRWDIDRYYDSNPDAPGKMSTRWGGFLERVDEFDPEFFGISSREAATLDPQQRLLLEVSWEALEHAGYAADKLFGSLTGVFVGIGSFDYMQLQLQRSAPEAIDAYLATGGCHSVAAGRVSYVLGLQGPSVSVDTACSSSLVSVHLACQSLRSRECNLALAGGVNVILAPELLINFSKAHMMAADGRCKVFDAAADGFVRAEGCGIVVLQRLSDAMANRANILAVIRGSALNQDGRSSGLTAPNGPSQQAVIRSALGNAGVRPADVQYVEAHGTGTSLGDPIEVQALGAAFCDGRSAEAPLMIGSVKTNIGHAEAAAGVAGLIKVVLALQHDQIPPHLHLHVPSPHINWTAYPIEVPTQAREWKRAATPRIAGVSSFGFSGTNAHVIVQDAPAPTQDERGGRPMRPVHLITVSARHPESLRTLAARHVEALASLDESRLADAAFTLNVGRVPAAHRTAVKAATLAEARDGLHAIAEGRERNNVIRSAAAAGNSDVVFMFTGQGSQYPQMGRLLYESEPTFRAAIDRCEELLRPHVDRPLRSVMYPEPGGDTPLNQTAYTQPAIFSLEYALVELWKSWGVRPAAVVGHSLGEDVAACVAGVFSLEDGLQMIAARGRLMQALPADGEMLAVFTDARTVRSITAPFESRVTVAAVNGPMQVTLSGERGAMRQVAAMLDQAGIKTRTVPASHAFHSPLMDPMLEAFEQQAAAVRYSEPSIPFVSNVTGELARPGEVSQPAYWRRHTRETVQFGAGLQWLYDQGYRLYVEIGPNSTLASMGRNALGADDAIWLPTIKQGRDWDQVLETLGALYVHGVPVDWEAFDRPFGRRRVALPTAPYRRRRYWFEEAGELRPSVSRNNSWEAVVKAGREQCVMVPVDLGLHTYPAKWDVLDRLSAAYITDAFRSLGLFTRAGETRTVPEMLETGILETYRHLLGRWARKLGSIGLLQQAGDAFVAPVALPEPSLAELQEEARQTLADVPFLFEYLERCGQLMVPILTGKESPLETLFPSGSPETAERIYHHWALSRYFGGIGGAVVRALAAAVPHGEVLRAIEVGAGTGGLTASLLPALPAERTVYCYTDVSEFFFSEAQKRFGSYPFLRCGVLDLEKSPQEQGYGAHGFDLVVAANVLHATQRLDVTIEHVKSLLAPGGMLLLYEVTNPPAWFDVSIALIEGWQRFNDGIRGDGPLISRDQWERLIHASGFEVSEAFPGEGSPAEILGAHIIVARMSGESAARAALPDVGTPVIASTPAARAVDSIAVAARTFAELAGLPSAERHERLVSFVRDEVLHVLRRRSDESVGRRERLMDVGVDSLMAVELRDRLTSGLALEKRLPATLIFDYPTVDAIAGLIAAQLPEASARESTGETAAVLAAQAVDDLSDQEIQDLLSRKLESL